MADEKRWYQQPKSALSSNPDVKQLQLEELRSLGVIDQEQFDRLLRSDPGEL